ncbi:MAG: AAA family ATPase [Gammaproteobacteria bacterium]|nr:AAA family ATPase [Gammaproteobacteria bacterium]
MPYPYYRNDKNPAAAPVQDLPPPWNSGKNTPTRRTLDLSRYLPDDGLLDAVNAALVLGLPLLLTGDAGAGKTKLAYHLAWYLGLDEPLKFETKSTSVARDLFYLYDAVGHFRAVQLESKSGGDRPDSAGYFTLNPLGLAILLSQQAAKLKQRLRDMLDTALAQRELPPYNGPRRVVVLIDEIDKAPRDFPNDLLNEIEEMYFRIPELAREIGPEPIRADELQRPVVVITSNSEKHLPEPFLRRCVYYNIPFPEQTQMKKIISAYAEGLNEPLLKDALGLFYAMRDSSLRKKPSTAELLAWLHLLRTVFKEELANRDHPFHKAQRPLAENEKRTRQTLWALIKVREDQEEELDGIIRRWLKPDVEL